MQLVITGLHPYANYSFAVAAATSAGLGPYSDAIIAETLESGKCVCVCVCVCVYVCVCVLMCCVCAFRMYLE